MARYQLPVAFAEELEDLGEFLADDYFPNGFVQPEVIARQNDITVSFNHYGNDFDGMLEHKAGRFHIYVNVRPNSTKSSPRCRFTLCHELGHFFIDEHRLALKSGSTPTHKSKCDFLSDNPVEIQADFFASSLILPRSRVTRLANKSGVGLEAILKIAEKFQSSVTASCIRYVSLELAESIVVKWDNSGVNWKRISPSVWQKGYRSIVGSLTNLPEDSATSKAFNNLDPQTVFFSGATTAATWIPSVSSSSNRRNLILNEHSMRLGRFGGVTVLTPNEGRFL